MFLQTVSNHPVHILNNEGKFSPSSFIPFCSFGQEFIGIKMKEFNIPVCNIFKPTIYLDQICYETDLQDLKGGTSKKIVKQLEMGLTLALDYNEERQNYNRISKNESENTNAPYSNQDDASIHFNTIGTYIVQQDQKSTRSA